MLTILRQNKAFLLPYLGFILLCFVILIMFSKNDIHIFINRNNNPFFDTFFKYFTSLGNGWFVVLLTLCFLLYSYRISLLIGMSGIMTGLVVQILKRFVFDDALRPVKHFQGIYELHLVKGIHVMSYFSFPSGHSATAFSAFFCFALLSKNNTLKIFFLLLAILIGYSRIYLSQHFLVDVFAGSLIGVIITFPVYNLIYRNTGNKFDNSLLRKVY